MQNDAFLRHDASEAALPHQVEPPAAWGLKLPDPIPFTVSIPRWCPVDGDALVELHWWASLIVHLNALATAIPEQEKAYYRVDKAIRRAVAALRDAFGPSLSAAIAVTGSDARANHKLYDGVGEMGAWTMALQVAFGLVCTRTAAKGKGDAIAQALTEIHELVDGAMAERLGDAQVHRMLTALCTGTLDGTVESKLKQWEEALAQAAEGAPEGVPGVAEALEDCGVIPEAAAWPNGRLEA